MSAPKIEFRYSWEYDWRNKQRLSYIAKQDKSFRKAVRRYPSPKSIEKTIMKYRRLWKKYESIIPAEISRISGLRWRQKIIYCYVVGHTTSFSEPLTLSVFKSDQEFVDTLTHELIHQLEYQNWDRIKGFFRWLSRKYKNETGQTRHSHHRVCYPRTRIPEIFRSKKVKCGYKILPKIPKL